LLFSCGEGIRLFPFPPVEQSSNVNSGWKNDGEISYQKNAPRFENKKESQSKLKREGGDPASHHRAGGFGSPEYGAFSAPAISRRVDVSFARPPVKSILVVQSTGSRPPPVSISL
jgi:hypothetical protein